MLRLIHQLSAMCFYLLGVTFFVAVVLLRNSLGGAWPAFWMQTADLPLLLTAMVYGGLSLYESIRPAHKHSPLIASLIAAPLAAFFLFLAFLNFWPA